MSQSLAELQNLLIEGQRLSMQGSYARRKPAAAAVPLLLQARAGLKAYLQEREADAQAWRLLSQAEECLLNYTAGRRCLERAMALSGRKDKKDLKKLALLREQESQWAELRLTPDQLAELGNHLQSQLRADGCDHTLRFTQQWLEAADVGRTGRFLEAFRNQGGYCDCEILNNVVLG